MSNVRSVVRVMLCVDLANVRREENYREFQHRFEQEALRNVNIDAPETVAELTESLLCFLDYAPRVEFQQHVLTLIDNEAFWRFCRNGVEVHPQGIFRFAQRAWTVGKECDSTKLQAKVMSLLLPHWFAFLARTSSFEPGLLEEMQRRCSIVRPDIKPANEQSATSSSLTGGRKRFSSLKDVATRSFLTRARRSPAIRQPWKRFSR